MSAKTILNGVNFDWSLTTKIGEGNAGEVWLAKSLNSQVGGILKRPTQNAFRGLIDRQAGSISTEENYLKALVGSEPQSLVSLLYLYFGLRKVCIRFIE